MGLLKATGQPPRTCCLPLALLLAAVDLYGVIAYSVSQTTREIGIRMALGARTLDVLRPVMGRGLTLTVLGLGVGLGGGFALARFMTSVLYGVTATDLPVYLTAAGLLGTVALTASFLPARRATQVSPVVALREE